MSGVAAVWPLAAGAQQGNKLPTVAVLGDLASVWNPWTGAFADRMGELGWIAGRNIAIEYRWSEGRQAPVAEIAAEFVRQKVDVIVTYGGAVTVLKQATASIPIVFAIAVDPVGIGLVASLRTLVATSPDCRSKRQALPASGSNFSGNWSPISTA
jgi:putative ABC transport system substrate-binding protein